MAVQRFKVPLNNAAFPFVSSEAPRAVFVPGLDVASRAPRGFVSGEESADYNLTQILYGENFMPVGNGVRSVGFRQIIAPTVNNDFDSIFPLRDEDENVVLYSPGAGKNYVYDTALSAWSSTTIPTIYAKTFAAGSNPANSRVTYAYVDGYTFVCFSRLKSNDMVPVDMSLLYWNSTTQSLAVPSTLISNIPFPAGEIDGIAGSNGYLIMWSGITIAWAPFSGTSFNFINYANGAFTGAGSQIPEDVQGTIRALIPVAGGFVAFTNRNAIGCSYVANNLQAPWIFREIPDAGGLESYEQATVEGSLGKIYAYTTAGMQSASLNSADLIFPDLADFIASREIERYNNGNQTLSQDAVTLDFYVKVTAVGNRYLVVSYGTFPGIYSYALIYDFSVKRWGKIYLVHRDCFYYNYGAQTADLTYSMLGDVSYDNPLLTTYSATTAQSNAFVSAPHGLAFLKQTGEVVIADWSKQDRATPDVGVLVLGRVQLTRSRNVQLNRVEIEGFKNGNVYVVPSYDGRNLAAPQQLTAITVDNSYRDFGAFVDCKNFDIIVQGTFDMSTMILEATPTGQF
jgi:hypothetical protein